MNKIILAVLLMSTVLLFSSCEDDNPSDPGPGGAENYFPNGEGTYYKYNVTSTDSAGVQEQGTRTTRYNGSQPLLGTNYQIQLDTLSMENIESSSISFFRKTDTGIFYFMDTTGLAEILPDTLEQYISADAEVRALLFPLQEGSSWFVFRLTLNYPPIVFYPVEVSASYAGTEDIILDLNSGQQTKRAVKIRYILKLTFSFGSPSRSYEAYAWVVDGIGIVKWDGNATLLRGISGSGIDFDDTTKVITQNLIEYDVK